MRLIGFGFGKSGGKKSAAGIAVIAVVLVLAVIFIGYLNGFAKADVISDADGIVAKATLVSTLTVPYQDMEKAEMRTDLDIGEKTSGLSTGKVGAGLFHNREFGDYLLYAHTNIGEYIVITLKDKVKDQDILVVNGIDKAKTDALFQQITEHLNQKSE